jgi:hypothetical protein
MPAAANQGAQTTLPWDNSRPSQDKASTVERVVSSINREAPEPVAKQTPSSGQHSSAEVSRESGEGSSEKKHDEGQPSDKTNNL